MSSPASGIPILVKTKTPQIQHLETVRNDADVVRLGDIVQAVDRAIRPGPSTRSNPR